MLTPTQRNHLSRLIQARVQAEINRAFMGCQPPEDWPDIQAAVEHARKQLKNTLREMTREEAATTCV